jgi:hypothetical protein
MPADQAARASVESVESRRNGEIIEPGKLTAPS